MRTLSQNCEQTLQKLRTNRIMNKRAFLKNLRFPNASLSRNRRESQRKSAKISFGLQVLARPLKRSLIFLCLSLPCGFAEISCKFWCLERHLGEPSGCFAQRALRDIYMSRRALCLLPTVSRQSWTRNYPRPPKLPLCLGEDFNSSFPQKKPSGKNCLAAIFASRH